MVCRGAVPSPLHLTVPVGSFSTAGQKARPWGRGSAVTGTMWGPLCSVRAPRPEAARHPDARSTQPDAQRPREPPTWQSPGRGFGWKRHRFSSFLTTAVANTRPCHWRISGRPRSPSGSCRWADSRPGAERPPPLHAFPRAQPPEGREPLPAARTCARSPEETCYLSADAGVPRSARRRTAGPLSLPARQQLRGEPQGTEQGARLPPPQCMSKTWRSRGPVGPSLCSLALRRGAPCFCCWRLRQALLLGGSCVPSQARACWALGPSSGTALASCPATP